MSAATICILATIALYLVMMVTIGAVFSKKNKNSGDFYLGGRKLGPLVTAMSAEASDMSSWLLMGLPGLALMTGIAEASWTAIGLAIGTYINWLIVAKRLRVYSQNINAITLPSFFSKRFGDSKNLLSLIAAIFIVVFFQFGYIIRVKPILKSILYQIFSLRIHPPINSIFNSRVSVVRI